MSKLRADFNALRSQDGANDPVRLRFIEALLRRWEGAPPRLQARLQPRLQQALDDYRAAPDRPRPAAAMAPASGQVAALTALLNALHQQEGDEAGLPLERALQQQELELVDAITATQAQPEPPLRRAELKAARQLRVAQARVNADRVVSQALAGIPEHCGPLNPQRLATRSLATMRDLSPHYLSRFVSYIDTLFWLEQAERKPAR